VSEYVKSDFHPDHDITVTEHGLGIDLNQNGNLLHVDQGQYERLAEILRRQEREVA